MDKVIDFLIRGLARIFLGFVERSAINSLIYAVRNDSIVNIDRNYYANTINQITLAATPFAPRLCIYVDSLKVRFTTEQGQFVDHDMTKRMFVLCQLYFKVLQFVRKKVEASNKKKKTVEQKVALAAVIRTHAEKMQNKNS